MTAATPKTPKKSPGASARPSRRRWSAPHGASPSGHNRSRSCTIVLGTPRIGLASRSDVAVAISGWYDLPVSSGSVTLTTSKRLLFVVWLVVALSAAPFFLATTALVHTHGPHDSAHVHWTAHDHGGAKAQATKFIDEAPGATHAHVASAHPPRSAAGFDAARARVLPDGWRAGTPRSLEVVASESDANARAAAQGRGWRISWAPRTSPVTPVSVWHAGSRPPNRSGAAPPPAEGHLANTRVLRI